MRTTDTYKLDKLDELIAAGIDDTVIQQMTNIQIREVSTVDQPATGRTLRFFKRAWSRVRGKADDLQGIGSNDDGAVRTARPPEGLANLERCLAANPDWSPAQCEAEAALQAALEADREGDDSTVSDPPTAGDFVSAKDGGEAPAAHSKPEGADECVQRLLDDPEFQADESGDRESSAFAICNAQLRRAPVPRKQEGLEPAIDGEPAPAIEVIEVPASPTPWPFATCIQDAADQGLDQDNSIAVCQIIRQDLGDPDDDEIILLPDKLTPEGLIQAAAIQAGIVKPEGMGGGGDEEAAAPEQALRFTGKNRWRAFSRRVLRLDMPKSMEQRQSERLAKEVNAMKAKQASQEALLKTLLAGKSKEDLIQLLMGQNASLFRALGLDTPVPTPVATEAADPMEAIGGHAIAAGESAGKSEGIDETEREELERLRAVFSTGSNADPVDESIGTAPQEIEAPEPGIPLIDGPLPETELVAAGVATVPPAAEPKRHRASVPISRSPGTKGNGLVTSTILGAAKIPQADRDALGW